MELGYDERCFDRLCRTAFQEWCQKKYGTLDTLNKAWGTVFWSHIYTAWTQIPLPGKTAFGSTAGATGVHNPSLELDYNRFYTDSVYEFMKFQVDILRKYAPGKAITENELGLLDQIDYSKLYPILDFASWDNYPMSNKDYADYG